jgi:hypothetical protein
VANSDAEIESANIPVLNWTAANAKDVAEHLGTKFKASVPNHQVHYNIRNPQLMSRPEGVRITCTGGGKPKTYPVVIVAVGFGLENPKYNSYWAGDDLADESRDGVENEKWLVSGFGDGALTDLMRLCLHKFRHHRIVRLFQSTAAMRGVIQDIRAVQRDNSNNPERLSDQFEKIQTGALDDIIKPLVRKKLPRVYLAGRDTFPYKPEASSLNRLIVLVLQNLNAFALRVGPSTIVGKGDGHLVTFPNEEPEYFDRVVVRHGPNSALQRSLNPLLVASQSLKDRWEAVLPDDDPTRHRLWPYGFFGPEVEIDSARRHRLMRNSSDVDAFGVHARQFSVSREIQDDGSSRTAYFIEGLKAYSGTVDRIRFKAEVAFGRIAEPEVEALSRQLGLT